MIYQITFCFIAEYLTEMNRNNLVEFLPGMWIYLL